MSRLRDPRQHDDLLNYQLKRLVRLGGAPAIRLCEGQYGVTRQEWRLIAALTECGAMSPSTLAGRAEFDPVRVAKTLASLVEKGFVRRVINPKDRRRASVAPTAAGKRLYTQLFPQLALINRRLMEVLSEDEAVILEDLLFRLTQRARQVHAAGGGVEARADRRLGGSRRVWSLAAHVDKSPRLDKLIARDVRSNAKESLQR